MLTNDFVRGTSIGLLLGVVITGLAVRKPFHDLMKLDEKQLARRKDTLVHVITVMGPYAPKEVLDEIYDYMKFNLIVSNEEGRELGIP